MILNAVFFVSTLMNVPSPSTATCYWGTNSLCVNLLRSILWYSKEEVNDFCCKSTGTDHILLCPQKNLQGSCVAHRVPDRRCVRLENPEPVMSVNTFGHCFRLYEREDCTGESIGVQPEIENTNDFKGFTKSNVVLSMSRCFRSDLCVSRSGTSINYEIGCHWPNHRLHHGSLPWLTYDIGNLEGGPVLWYQTGGWSNRTDVIHAHIFKHHVRRGPGINENARKYIEDNGFPGDEVGLILPNRFTGSGSDLRNIYPQSSDFKSRLWGNLENRIADIVRRYGSAYFTANLAYHLATDTRPYLIIYRVRPGDLSSEEIIINDMVNPQRE